MTSFRAHSRSGSTRVDPWFIAPDSRAFAASQADSGCVHLRALAVPFTAEAACAV